MKLLEFKNVGKNYHNMEGEIEALKNISFTINEGDFVAIVGPSGCGKSTILSILAKLDNVSSGKIITEKDHLKCGYMFQQDTLFDWLSIMDNCLLGPKINKNIDDEIINKCTELLKTYDLYEFKDRYPHELSGGMKQRVALIRTLMLNPDILLLDEPFSALDYQTRISVSNDVCNIIKNEKKTLIIVTHDISEAISMCNKIIVMSKRPSTIKKTYNIDYDFDRTNPIKSRSSKEFMEYYEKIWEDLNDEKWRI
mgnify:CR=1 FL=1